MTGKAKSKLTNILPRVLIIAIAVLAAVDIVLMAVFSKPTVSSVPPSPPIAACTHKNTTSSVMVVPTCTDTGVTAYTCDYCHTVVRTEPIAALGHDYTDAETSGLCKVCEQKICSRGLTYEPSDDGSYYIVSKKNPVPDGAELIDLVIPEYHDGKPVKEIAADAFVEQKYIKSVSIPSTMEYIGVGAFSTTELRKIYFNAENCRDFVGKNWVFYLSSTAPTIDVTIGKAVRHIPDRLFYPNNSSPDVIPKIKSVSFEEGCNVESIGEYAFYKTRVKDIVLPDSLKTIGEHAFDAGALESVVFGSGLSSVKANAFDSCNQLGSVDMSGSALADIAQNAFKNCSALTDVKLPACTVEVGAKAFYGCSALKTLELMGAERIGDDAFYGCSALAAVSLPTTLKKIGVRVFEGCTSISEIVYSAAELSDLASGNRVFYGAGAADGVSVRIADGVKYIPARLFYSTADASKNLHIKDLKISGTVTEIGEYAFRGTVIDGASYAGSAEDYSRITIGTGNSELGTPTFAEGE